MDEIHNSYVSPLGSRYASSEMKTIFSDNTKFTTWRKLWTALADAERQLGVQISQEQIDELERHILDIDYAAVQLQEQKVQHDVMAHLYAYRMVCPKAAPILHLGATSCFLTDNADIIIIKTALQHIRKLLVDTIKSLMSFAEKYKSLITLSYTHLQEAQPTTLGKRATIWMQDLIIDLEQLDFVLQNLKLLGCRGATGNGSSYLKLFNGDADKVKKLETIIIEKFGFDSAYDVSVQTYPRKIDSQVLYTLSGIAQSAQKFSNDIRFLSHLKEVEEPQTLEQVSSSAMPYKSNPLLSERITALTRYIIVDSLNPQLTSGVQLMERTLDDSANRRLCIPEAFLATDAVLSLYAQIVSGLQVFPFVIKKHVKNELPFICTEQILMHCVSKGKKYSDLYNALVIHSKEATRRMKQEGTDNDLVERIVNDPLFSLSYDDIDSIIDEQCLTGLAENHTVKYLKKVADLILTKSGDV